MRHSAKRALAAAIVICVSGAADPPSATAGTSNESIGLFTAVQGKVSVTHSASAQVLPVNVRDDVYFKDVIETRHKSRTKAFFDDETILTVGENSRVTVTEHIYNPDLDVRRVVINLFLGKLRALVGQAFTGAGSKFEIHTPTAVAAARGTYFVVWVDPSGASGIANIGEAGKVDFTSGGKTVTVAPGEYSVAAAGQAPEMPSVYQTGPETSLQSIAGVSMTASHGAAQDLTGELSTTLGETLNLATETLGATVDTVKRLASSAGATPAAVLDAIEGTTLPDATPVESPQQVVQALGLTPAETEASRDLGLQGSGAAPDLATSLDHVETVVSQVNTAVTQVLSAPSIVSGPIGATTGAVGTVGGAVGSVVSSVPLTPPAVTSGVTGDQGLPLP